MAFGCAVTVQLLGTVMAVRWWLRVRGLLLGASRAGNRDLAEASAVGWFNHQSR
jgi:hypothetical protein